MTASPSPNDPRAVGTAIACYTLWGLLPLLFMALAAHGFSAPEILAHRAVWSVFVAGLVLLLAGQWNEAKQALATPRVFGWLALSAAMIAVNWSLYVFATTHHATLEASLGYYINPLLNMAAGALLFREKIDRWSGVAIALVSGVALSACSSIPFVGGDKKTPKTNVQQGIGVNGYLWRASLDTLSFMPLANADPWGGVINYDWYINPQTPNERFKATVFILDTRLRADALNVTVTKEIKGADGQWTGASVAAQTEADLENAILTRARQLNLANAG